MGEEPHDNTQYVDGVLKKELENITDYTVVENADGTYTVTLPKTTETEKIGEGSVMILLRMKFIFQVSRSKQLR